MTYESSESSKRSESKLSFGRQHRRTFLRTIGAVVALGGASTASAESDAPNSFGPRYGEFEYGGTRT